MIEKITLKSPTRNFLKPENLPVNNDGFVKSHHRAHGRARKSMGCLATRWFVRKPKITLFGFCEQKVHGRTFYGSINNGNVSAFWGSSSSILLKILSACSLSIFLRSRETDFLNAILQFKFFPHVLNGNNRISGIMQTIISNLQISDFSAFWTWNDLGRSVSFAISDNFKASSSETLIDNALLIHDLQCV